MALFQGVSLVILCVVFELLMSSVVGQDVSATPEGCFSAGSIAGAVLGTLFVTLALAGIAFLVWRFYWRSRRGKHLVLVTDTEAGPDQYAFDNPCFRDGTPIGRTPPEKEPVKLDQKARWSAWSPIGALVATRNEKRRALDDSFVGEPQVQTVSLRSHDFTGLGFNICGNMRDGIFVKDVLHRGPASESGRISPGDRIDAIRISFRHMVFEDALTILSYASPYDVQLEVENAATSRPSTLIRTKRTSASSIAPADRICHPFYRSQSIADLAQIGKASLKRVQQMGGGINKSPHMSKGDPFDELGDYPTLKLSSSSPISTLQKRENAHVGKAAGGTSPQVTGSSPHGIAIVKPERAKRTTPRNSISSPEESEGKADTLSRFQKFGVRVLPDQATSRTSDVQRQTAAEAERHQNEQNIIRERVGSASHPKSTEISLNPFSSHKTTTDPTSVDITDGRKSASGSLHYDERGIDVGPIEKQSVESGSPEHISEETAHTSKLIQRTTSTEEESDVNKESHVKHLLTKGLQNLKEKLHHDKRKSPEFPRNNQDENPKQGRKHTVSMSSDSEGMETEKAKETGVRYKANPKEDPEKRAERRRQRNPEKDGFADQIPLPPDENIPTEIPEEVRRAAVAARSNRKSFGIAALPDVTKETTDKGPNISRESMSDSSSDCDVPAGIASDSLGRPPKRSNKRKAPPPPPEDADDTVKSLPTKDDVSRNSEELDFDTKVLSSWQSNMPGTEGKNEAETSKWSMKTFGNPNPNLGSNTSNNSTESGKIITTFANMARQRANPEPSKKDITNITIDDGSSHILSTYTSRRVSEGSEQTSPQGHVFPMDSSSSGTSTMETKTVDYDEGVHVHAINSDSDSDLERLEGDDDEFEGKRNKKGGTTIELNSSHITIHHSPSSAPDLESDSTRKAASLGDLSRLDTEQPMSILERAVSLDLADGGTPLGTKKRKAPPPPPGEEYLTSAQDEEGGHYRKEPRLDAAMDTLQRRRLKKSSEWGTMEEALKQSENNFKVEPTDESFPIEKTSPKLAGTSFLEITRDKLTERPISPEKDEQTPVNAKLSVGSFTVSDITSSNVTIKEQDSFPQSVKSDMEIIEHVALTSSKLNLSPEREKLEDTESSTAAIKNSSQQQKTVLHISPKVTNEHESSPASSTSQVSISPSSHQLASSGDFVEHERLFSGTQQEQNIATSPEHHISSIVSSTPLSTREFSQREQVQSPLVTSSDAGISSIQVSSSTQDISLTPSELDSSILVTSATDPFVTAASFVDSTITTTMAENASDDEGTWEPPELPTSPVPVLNPGPSSTFNASPSMTYITEIQVVTTTDNENDHKIGSTTNDIATNGSAVTSTFTQGTRKYRSDSSLSSDSMASDRDDKDASTSVTGARHSSTTTTTTTTNTTTTTTSRTVNDGSLGQPLRSNVSFTSISTLTSPTDRSKVLTGTEIFGSALSDGSGPEMSLSSTEKKAKPARPPVPPRKSDSSSSSVSSTIMVEVPKVQLAETTSSSLLAGGTVSQGSPGGGKFISFSSLTPRHSSSFEQWVFLDEANPGNRLNGIEGASNSGGESEGGNSQSAGASRAQTITHIILDTKQKSGGHVKQ
ncbi:uncharacterized protein [Anabrus simplex]|uniref:uncharacterized protein n=1 Tax=Anabrus simplex TaxID=316456 RepID=UPI0035A39EC9